MLCENGHNNAATTKFCSVCGSNKFQAVVTTNVVAGQTTNGLAIASLVLGIVWIWGVTSILAIIFAVVAKKQISVRGQKGSGMATAGLVLGIIGAVLLVFVIIGAASSTTSVPVA